MTIFISEVSVDKRNGLTRLRTSLLTRARGPCKKTNLNGEVLTEGLLFRYEEKERLFQSSQAAYFCVCPRAVHLAFKFSIVPFARVFRLNTYFPVKTDLLLCTSFW